MTLLERCTAALRPLPLDRRAQRIDLAIAGGLLVTAMLSVGLGAVAGAYGGHHASPGLSVAYAACLAAPLAVRRRWPSIVAVLVSAVYFTGASASVPEFLAGNIAVFLGFYTLGAWSPARRRAAIVRIVITMGMFVWLLVSLVIASATATNTGTVSGAMSPFVAQSLLGVLINVLFFAAAWYFGDRAWWAQQQRALLEQRTHELESAREHAAEQAVSLERVRIARELHDVVAHHVSLMGVQAGAARMQLPTSPDTASATLAQVEASARSALTELRQLLSTLRTADDTVPAASALGLAGIERLTMDATRTGLPTSFRVIGAPIDIPTLADVNLYRITQEALTNARRHGGAGTTADVRVRFIEANAAAEQRGDVGASVEVEVSNTGRIATSAKPGLGHTGMRERAEASGGTIELRPRSSGGFIVRVRLPLMSETRSVS